MERQANPYVTQMPIPQPSRVQHKLERAEEPGAPKPKTHIKNAAGQNRLVFAHRSGQLRTAVKFRSEVPALKCTRDDLN